MKNNFKSIVSFALICLMFVACFSGCKKETTVATKPPLALQESVYLAVCETQEFKVYNQEVTKESTSGIVKGYIATKTSSKIQMDFYEFTSAEHAQASLDRLSDWASSKYSSEAKSSESSGYITWEFSTEEVYARAVRVDKYLLYIFCSDPVYKEQAMTIFNAVAVIG